MLKHKFNENKFTTQKLNTYLFIRSASFGLNVKTQMQKMSWYWIWKLTRPERTLSRVEMPSTVMNADLYASMRSIICRQRATDCMYSLFCKWNVHVSIQYSYTLITKIHIKFVMTLKNCWTNEGFAFTPYWSEFSIDKDDPSL